ncbi:MAG: hypothetical protein V4686_02015 [Patescibacteria group bacterium]
MVKNNNPKPKEDDEVDIFAQMSGEESPDLLITSEESITITLFEDEPAAELTEEEEDFETNIFSNKKKAVSEEEDNDFDSYFFEE